MSYVELPGAKVPIRMWTDPASVDEGALQQLRNVATLPWIKGLAVMPDVHYGKGPCARPRWAWTSAAGCRRYGPL
jgi:tRNA-splicing ligase RtcB